MLPEARSYSELRGRFAWDLPERFNIGVDVCDRWAERDPGREAIVLVREDGGVERHSFAMLRDASNRLANLLRARGVGRGDRVGILLPQHPLTAAAHIAVLKAGAIAVPLFTLFGPEALAHRMGHCGMRALVTDAEGAGKVAPLRPALPALRLVLDASGGGGRGEDLPALMAEQPAAFEPVDTAASDPALLIYTSGTTGPPKGALHAHRVLLGHLPGVEMSHDLLPRPGDRLWTPADWAWIGGLLDVLMPGLHHGVPVVARRFRRFGAEAAFRLMAEHGVRNAFLPPTALRAMRRARDEPWPGLSLRSVASGGEPLGPGLADWARRVLGVTVNEFYGQTECNMVVSCCGALMEVPPGAMGRAVPGHEVAVVDEAGAPVPDGALGTIAVRRPDPVLFAGYWDDPEATAARFAGDWLLTGDRGTRDADGWLRFVGRDDDVITSAGYRIGPGEIEDCLAGHPAVAMAGVVGAPDPERTEIVRAFVVLREGAAPSAALAEEIGAFVAERLAAHERPREIRFVDELPTTATGKLVRRALRERG